MYKCKVYRFLENFTNSRLLTLQNIYTVEVSDRQTFNVTLLIYPELFSTYCQLVLGGLSLSQGVIS